MFGIGTVEVHAGDFTKGKDSAFGNGLFLMKVSVKLFAPLEKIPIENVEEIDVATEERVKKLGGTVGWGITGAVLLGPVGLLAGLLLGGRKNMVTFVCKFKDGRKFLGTTNSKTWTAIMAARF